MAFNNETNECISLCEDSLVYVEYDEDESACIEPCESSEDYFYTSDGKCLSTCNNPYRPLVIDGYKICVSSLSPDEILDTLEKAK